MENTPRKSLPRLGPIIVVVLLVIVMLVFVVELATTTQADRVPAPETPPELTAETYMDTVDSLLANANPQEGAALVEQFGCVACHRMGADRKIAPPFAGIAERAASRRLPLTAAAYIYESIITPLAYVVEGYDPAMPQNFRQRLSDQQLGDILAYLLTPDAK